MNSFGSVFGSDLIDKDGFTKNERQGILKIVSKKDNEEFYLKVLDFHKIYHTIGNFAVLPAKPGGRSHIGLFRNYSWKDYFDLFLIELEKGIVSSEDSNEKLKSLIDSNDFYFEKFNCEQGFKDLCKVNFFEDYLCNNKINASCVFEKHFVHTGRNSNSCEIYRNHDLNYIDRSTEIINSRGNEILKRLRVALSYTIK